MAKMLVNETTLTAIADAIRAKTKSTEAMLPSEMAGLIETISGVPVEFAEFEVVTHTVASLGSRIEVPCSFSAAPTKVFAWCDKTGSASSSTVSTRTVLIAYADGYEVSGGNSGAEFAADSMTISGGKVTIDASSIMPAVWTIVFMR